MNDARFAGGKPQRFAVGAAQTNTRHFIGHNGERLAYTFRRDDSRAIDIATLALHCARVEWVSPRKFDAGRCYAVTDTRLYQREPIQLTYRFPHLAATKTHSYDGGAPKVSGTITSEEDGAMTGIGRMLRVSFAVSALAVTFAGSATPAEAQLTQIQRLMCPILATSAGCVRLYLSTRPSGRGGTTVTAVIQNLQAPQYPGDPSYSGVSFISFAALLAPGVQPPTPKSSQSQIGYYGRVQNVVGSLANTWQAVVGAAPGISSLSFLAHEPHGLPMSFGIGGCTQGPAFNLLGYQTCPNAGYGGAVVLKYDVGATFDLSSVSHVLVSGNGFMASQGTVTPWDCDAMVLGDYDAPFVGIDGPCRVSVDTTPLAVGPLTMVITPEPTVVAMLIPGALILGGVLRRRKRV